MSQTGSSGHRLVGAEADSSTRPVTGGEITALCTVLTDLGVKLDRLEDAVQDLTQVLARSIGPPWDVTGA